MVAKSQDFVVKHGLQVSSNLVVGAYTGFTSSQQINNGAIISGNVGVGTSTVIPGTRLQVTDGNLRISSANTGILFQDGTLQTTAATNTPSYGLPYTIQFAGTANTFSGDSTNLIWDNTTATLQANNISVTGTTPATTFGTGAFTTVGGASIGGNLYIGGSFTVGGQVNFSNVGGIQNLVVNSLTSNTSVQAATTIQGNDIVANVTLGVGTSVANYPVDVYGNIHIGNTATASGLIFPDGSFQSTAARNTPSYGAPGTVQIAGAANTFSGNSDSFFWDTTNTQLNVDQMQVNRTLTANTVISNVYGVFGQNVTVNSTNSSTSSTTGALTVLGGVGIAGNLNAGGTTHSFQGNVGIGTTLPEQKLDIVNGHVAIDRGFYYGVQHLTAFYGLVGLNSANKRTFGDLASNTGTRVQIDIPGIALETNANPILFNNGSLGAENARLTSTGNFGLGTTSPGSVLDVNGVASFRSAISVASTATVNSLVSNSTITGTALTVTSIQNSGSTIVQSLNSNTNVVATNIQSTGQATVASLVSNGAVSGTTGTFGDGLQSGAATVQSLNSNTNVVATNIQSTGAATVNSLVSNGAISGTTVNGTAGTFTSIQNSGTTTVQSLNSNTNVVATNIQSTGAASVASLVSNGAITGTALTVTSIQNSGTTTVQSLNSNTNVVAANLQSTAQTTVESLVVNTNVTSATLNSTGAAIVNSLTANTNITGQTGIFTANVGIGTSILYTGDALRVVGGNINVAVSGTGILFPDGSFQQSSAGSSAAGTDKAVQFNNGGLFAGQNNFIFDKNNIRLGIGTTNLTNSLMVFSATPALFNTTNGSDQQLIVGNTETTGIVLGFNSSSGTGINTYGYLSAVGAAAKNISVTKTGTGIGGITIPQNTLDVGGGVAVGFAYAGSITAPSNGLIVQGSIGVGSSVPVSKLDVIGGGAFTGAVSAGGALSANSLTSNTDVKTATINASSTIVGQNIYSNGFVQAAGTIVSDSISSNTTVTAGTGLTVTAGGMTVTGTSSFTGNVNITGNVNVTGAVNSTASNILVVQDPLIYVGANNPGDLYDLGIVGSYTEGSYYNTGIVRNHIDNFWTVFDTLTSTPNVITGNIDWSDSTLTYGPFKAGNIVIVGNTASTGTTSGALILNGTGGLGVGGRLNVGGSAWFAGTLNAGGTAIVNALISNTSINGGVTTVTTFQSGAATVNSLNSNTNVVATNIQSTGQATVASLVSNGAISGTTINGTSATVTSLQSSGTVTVNALVSNGAVSGTTGTFTGALYGASFNTAGTATVAALVSNGAVSGTTGTFTGALYGASFNTAGVATVNSLVSNGAISGTTINGTSATVTSLQNSGTETVNVLIANVYGRFGQNVTVNSTNTSTSTTTGALIVAGGVGIGGNINVGGINNYFLGNVGIGVNPSDSKLAVVGSGASISKMLSVTATGVGGGAAAPFYGAYIAVGTNNNATIVYGTYSELTYINGQVSYAGFFKNAGQPSQASYGIYGETTQTDLNGPGIAYGGYLKVNSGAVGTLGQTYGLRLESNVTTGVAAYGLDISTLAGATNVYPLNITHASTLRMRMDGTGNVGIGSATSIAGSLFAGDITSNTSVTATTLTLGGTATVNALISNVFGRFGQNVTVNSTNASTNTTSGALVVSGGVGIAGNINAGGSLNVIGNAIVGANLQVQGGNITTAQTGTAYIFNSNIAGLDIGRSTSVINMSQEGAAAVYIHGDLVLGNKVISSYNAGPGSIFNTNVSTLNIGGAALVTNIGNTTGVLYTRGDISINGGDILTTATTATVFNSNVTTLSIGQAATTLNIGANSGTLIVGNPTVRGTQTTQSLYNTVATTINFGGAATTISVGASTGTTTFNSTNASTSTTTGAFILAGGAGIGGNINVGGANNLFTNRVGIGTSTVLGARANVLSVYGNADVYGNIDLNNPTGGASGIYFADGTYQTTAAGSSTPYSNINVASYLSGPVQIGNLTINNTTASTSTLTGALLMGGGAGIQGAVHIGGLIYGASTLNIAGAAQVNSLISNGAVSGTTGTFTGALYSASFNTAGTATVNALVSNGAVSGTTGTFTGALYGASFNTAGTATVNALVSNGAISGTSATVTSLQNSGTTTVQSLNSNTNVVATNLQSTGLASVASLVVNAGITAQTLTTSGAAIVSSITSNSTIQSAGALTAASITSNAGISGASATITNNLYSGTANINGALQAGSIASNGAVSGTTGTFTGALYGGNFNTAGTATVNALVSNTDVKTATVNASSTIVGQNIYSNGFVQAAGTVTGQAVSSNTTVTAGTGLTVTSGGMTVTGTSSFTGNVNITGNVNVTGAINSTSSNILVVQDPLIYVGQNNPSDLYDLGIVGAYTEGAYYNTGIVRNHIDNFWTVFDTLTSTPNVITGNIDWSDSTLTYGPFKAGNIVIVGNTASTGTTSGALIINGTGGVGVGGRLNVGGTAWFAGVLNAGGTAIVNALISNTSINGTALTVTSIQNSGTTTVQSLNSNTNVVATNIQSTGQATVASLVSNGAVSGTTGTFTGALYGGSFNTAGTATVNALVSNGAVSGTTGTFTGALYGASFNTAGTATVNALVSNGAVSGTTGTFTGALYGANFNTAGTATVNALVSNGAVSGTTGTFTGALYGGSFNTAGTATVNSLVSNGAISGTTTTVTSLQNSGTTTTNALVSNIFGRFGQNVTVNSTNTSTSTTTGALIVAGGAGIAGAVHAGGLIYGASTLNIAGAAQVNSLVSNGAISGTTITGTSATVTSLQNSGTTTTNALISNVYGLFGQNVTVNSTNASTSTTTGAFILAGGAGIGGNINVGGANSLFTNRVGIGTSAVLGARSNVLTVYGTTEIYGNIDISNTSTGGSGIYFPDGSFQQTASAVGGINQSVQFNDNGLFGGQTNFIYDKTNVRLGIGTTDLTNSLMVFSATPAWFNTTNGADQQIIIGNSTSTGTVIGFNSSSGTGVNTNGYISAIGAAARNISITRTGTGIGGVTLPQNTLEIGGTTIIGGTYSGNNNFINPPSNGLAVQGSVGVGTFTPASTLDVRGGGAFTGAVNVGGTATVNALVSNIYGRFGQNVTVNSTNASTTSATGALTVAGGAGIAGRLNVGDASWFASTLNAGGAFIANSINSNTNVVGVNLQSTGTTTVNALVSNTDVKTATVNASSSIVGASIISNSTIQSVGVATFNSLVSNTTALINGTVTINGTTNATSTSSGALTVAGGVGIIGNLYVGGNIVGAGNVTVFVGNSGVFYGDGNGFGALYAGIPTGYVYQPQTVLQVSANINDFAQLNVQNINPGTNASTDIVATADNGTSDDGYITMGINSSGWDVPDSADRANDGYLFMVGNTTLGTGNLVVGVTSDQHILFTTGGTEVGNVQVSINHDQGLHVENTGSSTSTTTGAFLVNGGTGIAENLHVGGLIYGGSTLNIAGAAQVNSLISNGAVSGTTGTFTSLQNSGTTTTNALISNVYGRFGQNVTVSSTNASTSTTTGAFILSGGAGIAGAVHAGGLIYGASTLNIAGAAQVNSLISNGAVSGTTGTFTSALYGASFNTAGTATVNALVSNGAVSGTTGTFTGALYGGSFNTAGTATVNALVSNGAISGTVFTVTSIQSSGTATVNALVSNVYGRFGQNVTVNSTNASTSTTTGAIVTAGGVGVAGNINTGGSQNTFSGNVGVGTTTVGAGYKLQVVGAFAATTKSFVIDHPTKPGKLLRYGSLEGPENGVYVRGRITNNTAIALPDYWSALVDENTITVNLTPIGNSRTPRVDRIENNTVFLKKPLVGSLDCYFVIFGERKDVGKLDVEV